jgi:GT2 family glycosyltransferase
VTPPIGVVVLHHGEHNEELTLRCLRALRDDTASPPRLVVLVDNGPGTAVGERVRRELPEVEVVSPGRNTGFAGGCNAGIAHLGDRVDLVALLNNDAVPEPGWLASLADALHGDPRLGAVVPKTRFDRRFHELVIEAAGTWRPGRGDGRELAWQPKQVLVDGVDVMDACQLVDGFWEPGRGGRWAGRLAVLRVPAPDPGPPHEFWPGSMSPGAHEVGPELVGSGVGVGVVGVARLVLATPPGRAVELTINGTHRVTAAPGDASAVDVPLDGPPLVVLANVGNERRADGYGLDLGRFEVDLGQHDLPEPVPAWCGGAVLLRRAYLDDVGPFDERLFLYYEDLELSLRGAARGWRYAYEPDAVVDHRVGASTVGAAVARAERRKERNRLLVLARHPSSGTTLGRELLRFTAVTLAYVRREIVAPPLRGAAPCGWLLKVRGLALLGALPRLPGQLLARRRDRRR